MKHLILLFVISLCGYVAWQLADKRMRRKSVAFAGRHVTPIVVLVAILFALVLLAAQLPSASIL